MRTAADRRPALRGGTRAGVGGRHAGSRLGMRGLPRRRTSGTRASTRLPVHEMSDTWLRSADADATDLHPDFGPPDVRAPVRRRRAPPPKVRVDVRLRDESDRGPVPVRRANADRGRLRPSRADRASGAPARCTSCSRREWNDGDPRAGSGAIFDLDSNACGPRRGPRRTPRGSRSSPGSCAGTRSRAGSIEHAIRFTVDCTTDDYVWPARHEAGVDDPDCPPMGARFRLKAEFDLSGFAPKARTILRAMQGTG